MPAKVTISIDVAGETAKIQKAGDAALTLIRDEIIEDMNKYVPISGGEAQNGGGGALRACALLHSDMETHEGKLTVRWDEPYAQYQYYGDKMNGTPTNRTYGPEKLKYTASAARAEWDKYAQEQHGADWALQAEKRMVAILKGEMI